MDGARIFWSLWAAWLVFACWLTLHLAGVA